MGHATTITVFQDWSTTFEGLTGEELNDEPFYQIITGFYFGFLCVKLK